MINPILPLTERFLALVIHTDTTRLYLLVPSYPILDHRNSWQQMALVYSSRFVGSRRFLLPVQQNVPLVYLSPRAALNAVHVTFPHSHSAIDSLGYGDLDLIQIDNNVAECHMLRP